VGDPLIDSYFDAVVEVNRLLVRVPGLEGGAPDPASQADVEDDLTAQLIVAMGRREQALRELGAAYAGSAVPSNP
jgi:hypothetical protein